jgi:hypothetical protein
MRHLLLLLLLITGLGPVSANFSDSAARAVEWLIFSRKSYGKYLEVQSYVLDRAQVAQLLADPGDKPVQKTEAELHDQPQYLVFRLVNRGGRPWGGVIVFSVDCRTVLETDLMPGLDGIDPVRQEYYVMPIGHCIRGSSDAVPEICHRWKELYVE